MRIFLKLPDELLVQIIKYINDNSKIEELISIPTLQKYALQARYYKYQLVEWDPDSDGTMHSMKLLYEIYNFRPSRIKLEVDQLHELLKLEEPSDSRKEFSFNIENMNEYRHAEFEIVITDYMDVDLESILKTLNVVGVHLLKEEPSSMTDSDSDLEIEPLSFQNYLQTIQLSKIKLLKIEFSFDFVNKFPTSLKELKINLDHRKVDLNLSELQCLEYFTCESLLGVESLDALQLSKTTKSIELINCEFKTLGNMRAYNFLRHIKIRCCRYLFPVIKSFYPESLETLMLWPTFNRYKIRQLHESVKQGVNTEFELSDFSRDGNSFLLGSNFKLSSNTKFLRINGNPGIIVLGSNLCLKSLQHLELYKIRNLDLNDLFASLPENMIRLQINSCLISKVDIRLNPPNIRHMEFTYNKLSNIFQINLMQLRSIDHLRVLGNILIAPDYNEEIFDPSWLFLNELNVFKRTSECSIKKRKVCGMTKTSQIDLASITLLDLTKSFPSGYSLANFSNDTLPPPSQICVSGCTALKVLNLSGLGIQVLDLNKFPCSLVSLTITKLELLQIKGYFGMLNRLKLLNLDHNEITYSMLVAQKFPSTLKTLDLSGNKIEDLTCLKIDNCIRLRTLTLEKVTKSSIPNGANELKELFIKLVGARHPSRALVTTYEGRLVFHVVDGKAFNEY
ncbi:uncharacterized protein KGF55_002431 [Candida pseudojiufengensis]|uniref:uncharacterized protein n=1 Tax=Candida pseudojiufengensis TaxID=497109 RepID=UPI0022256DD7|nr:uncharacterized protein KGF55_002431 [Candida pseudojiufengensis]KAI5963551.1 hypothetical protein KGF55_002431 [Candida pseudojiufengensis]